MRESIRRWGFRGFIAALLVAAGYYTLFGGVYSVMDIREMRAERAELVDRLDSLIARTDSLEQRADSLESDPLSIERTAREEHGLVKPGEVVVRFHPADGDEAKDPPE